MVDFLVLGNGFAVHYNELFPLIKEERVMYGYSITSGDRLFQVPDDYEFYGQTFREIEGGRYIAVKGVRWITNMRDDYPPMLELKKLYVPGDYKKFDKYDAIYIEKTSDIPMDYDGVMGVPITFLDKWNRDQFQIIGKADSGSGLYDDYCRPIIDGEFKFTRLLIKRR